MVEIKNLKKHYGKKLVIDDVSFHLEKGDILGFLGPNGAGKSTTMNMITGYIFPDEGTITIDGCDMLKNPKCAKSKLGYLPEQPPLYLDMTVKNYLSFVYDLKKVKLNKSTHIEEICDLVSISDVKYRLIKNLSKGYKQRVGLAQALIGYPEILILDEPTVGLDPRQIIEIRKLIKDLSKRHSIILSSHILSEIQAVCNRVVVINKGKVIADDETSKISSHNDNFITYSASVKGDPETICSVLSSIDGVSSVENVGEEEDGVFTFKLTSDGDRDIRQSVFSELVNINSPLLGFSKLDGSLEDIFVELTDKNTDMPESDIDTFKTMDTNTDESINDTNITDPDKVSIDEENLNEPNENGGKN